MHLAELIRLRTTPAAGLLLALTQRCPLRCAHCSTSSTMDANEYDATPLRRLISTFTAADHPELIFMSGGEPLLRPGLVAELASGAQAAGTRSALLSGMFFARRRIPAVIRRAIATLDHFSASIDPYHEREVSRDDVFAALSLILDLVPAVSLHVTGSDTGYVDELLRQVRHRFGDRVPALVVPVKPVGRARAFTAEETAVVDAGPCDAASWPLVDYDGAVYSCSRQSLARRYRPEHLVLGHAAEDSWAQLRSRARAQPVMRSVRALGALETARQAGVPTCGGACQTCLLLPAAVTLPAGVELVVQQLLTNLRPRELAQRWGAGPYADWVELGWAPCAA